MSRFESKHSRETELEGIFRDQGEDFIFSRINSLDVRNSTIDDQLNLVQQLDRRCDPDSLNVRAEMYHEIAQHAQDTDSALEIESHAESIWQSLINTYVNTQVPLHPSVLKAHKHMAYMPMYYWDILNPHTPAPKHLLQSTFEGTLNTANMIDDQYLNTLSSQLLKKHISGEMSEISIVLILQRFGLNIDEGNYWPYASFATQNYQKLNKSTQVNASWDVSVNTWFHLPETQYKLQVKNSRDAEMHGNTYSDDITLVYLRELVEGFRFKRESPGFVVPRLMQSEIETNDKVARLQLDVIQDRLFDVMDG